MAKPTLLQAIVERWEVIHGTPPSLPIFLGEAPEDVGQFLPLAYLEHRGEQPGYSTVNGPGVDATKNAKPNRVACEFNIVVFQQGGVVAIETLTTPILEGFKPGSLAMDGGQEAWLFRTNYLVTETKKRDKEDRPIYKAIISYQASIGNPIR